MAPNSEFIQFDFLEWGIPMITALRSKVKRPNRRIERRLQGGAIFRKPCGHSPSYTKIGSAIYKVAETRAEREAAFRLVYEAYTASGLIPENAFGMRVTSYHLSPMTGVLLATFDHVPTHTVSLIEDAELGLPLEELYRDEVKEMREQKHQLAEVSCLAARTELLDRKSRFDTYVNLMGLMAQYARWNGVDRLVVACHPRHAHFYVDFLGFEVFGQLKSYDTVNGNPAVGCYHDFATLDRTGYRLRDRVYGATHEPRVLSRKPISSEDRAYFTEPAAVYATSGFLPTAA